MGLRGKKVIIAANTNVAINAFVEKMYKVLDELEQDFLSTPLVSLF